MLSLTPRQAEVLAFILDFQRERGMPPTRVEIAAHFGWSSANAAQDHIRALTRKGALRLPTHRHARAIYPV
jgi:repressor LexA